MNAHTGRLDTGEDVRRNFDVPAHLGDRVTIVGLGGEITGFDGDYLEVLMDHNTAPVLAHPTWLIRYET